MHVDADRLREDIEANARFGAVDADNGVGRTALTGSEADRQVRERFVERLTAAGLSVRVDPVGNIVGRWTPAGCDPEAAPVAVGSHLDSVPRGGIFDGPLGVYAALESVRAMQSAEVTPGRPVEVVSFTEEEGGRFGVGTLGSSVAAGQRTASEALSLTDDDGTSLEAALRRIGFDGDDTVEAGRWDSWVELHVEQGTTLTDAGAGVGIVDSITGITNCEVRITGEADHAGSTPMDERTDALAAASEFILDLERVGWECAKTSDAAVATAGEGAIAPNARNIVPERVELDLDIRDIDHDTMTRMVDRCRDSLARLERTRGVDTSIERYRDSEPTPCSDRFRTAAEAAAATAGVTSVGLPSGAMHDTANVAAVTDAGLLFAPSEGGYSHSPREWTDWSDCAAATAVLAETVRSLAST
ncbi:Zn-dependent hydrolase [Haloarcula sediminis]|uniref:Zn-dependent hydrolase n=1 Tax=Haloarcula sediminis TaxID=3111777 RepID=UPI002D79B0C4|nr:Zn-dependent hydrolase [Haloarcula sp. CK38]